MRRLPGKKRTRAGSGSVKALRRRGCRDEDGFAGGFAALLFGMLLFVIVTLLVANAWGVVTTKAAAVDAAREAARIYVEAPNGTAAALDARQAADAALAGYGRDPGLARVRLVSGSFGRCRRVTIAVSYPSPVVELPVVGRVGTGERVRAIHSELVDPYRSGLPGAAACM